MKVDRLIGILTHLLQRDKSTALELAQRFEVSRRTILRDIDALSRAGIPICATRGGDGGIAIMPGYKIDKSVLTVDELQSIMTGLKSLDSVSKTPDIGRLMQKLSPEQDARASVNDHILIDLSSHYKDSLSEKIALIRRAIREGRLVEFVYYYGKGEARRRIEPYFIQFKWTSWYVYGFCAQRQGFRLFKMNRLWELELAGEHFLPRAIPADAAQRNGVSPEPYHVRLLFDRAVRFRLIEDYGPHCYAETDRGLVVELDYANREYIKSWILGFGEAVTVQEPGDFREEIRRTAEKMVQKHL